MDYRNLFHAKEHFEREAYAVRMEEFGFKNMGRMELFLWDLELFLQIQKVLGNRIILKGGAATQFYLPKEVQRTSVDIDMIFWGTEKEIVDTLKEIEQILNGENELFQFHKHIPKNPKTALPLHTYFVNVPSVLTNAERNIKVEKSPHQELKLEFILQSEKLEFEKKTGENIFAVNSKWEYQILPLDYLFADKLTTLGNNTIGVQNERMDEQVKQFYDILMLTRHCLSQMKSESVAKKYFERAKEEWETRERGIYDIEQIVLDVRKQLFRYAMADSGEDMELKKYINDFRSLYLNRKVEYSPQEVACGASMIRIMYELMLSGESWEKLNQAASIESRLALNHLSGKEKGQKTKEIRTKIIEEFGKFSNISPSVLKGKNLRRVFWAVADKDNLEEIENLLDKLC